MFLKERIGHVGQIICSHQRQSKLDTADILNPNTQCFGFIIQNYSHEIRSNLASGYWRIALYSRADVLASFSVDHSNCRLIQRCKYIFQNVSELIIDAYCMNFNENHCFRAKTAVISVITE